MTVYEYYAERLRVERPAFLRVLKPFQPIKPNTSRTSALPRQANSSGRLPEN
jgi:hypothetical protein